MINVIILELYMAVSQPHLQLWWYGHSRKAFFHSRWVVLSFAFSHEYKEYCCSRQVNVRCQWTNFIFVFFLQTMNGIIIYRLFCVMVNSGVHEYSHWSAVWGWISSTYIGGELWWWYVLVGQRTCTSSVWHLFLHKFFGAKMGGGGARQNLSQNDRKSWMLLEGLIGADPTQVGLVLQQHVWQIDWSV